EGSYETHFEETYQISWRPFLSVLYRFPDISALLHYSGIVLRWLESRHPEFLMLLEEMVLRKQIELLGGGFFAPLLPLVPGPDRLGQIELLTTYIRKAFGKRPRGCWLQEYAWEPGLASTIQTCGFDYTFLPERHFRFAGIEGELLGEPSMTEDQGRSIVVFPVFDALESFAEPLPPTEALASLKNRLGELPLYTVLYSSGSTRTMWESSGLESPDVFFERSFSSLQRASLEYETTTPSRYIKGLRQFGRAYFTGSGSSLLMERSLRPEQQRSGTLVDDDSPSLRRGSPRRLLLRHEESLSLYAKMHYVRILVSQLRGDKSRKKTAQEELWRGQCGDAYWQGATGGILRLPLRAAAYAALIEAEKTTRQRGTFSPGVIRTDIDFDGQKEILYQGLDINAYVHLQGGCLTELDSFKTRTNYVNVLGPDPERRRRACFRDRIFAAGGGGADRGSFADSQYSLVETDGPAHLAILARDGWCEQEGRRQPLSIRKTFTFRKGGLTVDYELINRDIEMSAFRFAVELNFSAGSDPASVGLSALRGREIVPLESAQVCSADGLTGMRLENLRHSEHIDIRSDTVFDLAHEPVYIDAGQDSGQDGRYQGCRLMCFWEVGLAPEASQRLSITMELRS
ncbi:MAG TPA: alpha-amylase/4-alpha-glucanotransferase domain-containing protein, partial [Rectinemataceae bacterium]|nr:alpha-amylase/4-alpha-glucanotransferase domain-containing protein [Rectinemataceae bacterium]